MKQKISTLIVENDILSIKILNELIEKYCPKIEIIREANNTEKFIELFEKHQPDLLILNLEEGKNTLEILDGFKDLDCEIIIISSNEFHAIKAINFCQLSGYILKPVDVLEFKKVIKKAVKNIEQKNQIKEKLKRHLSNKLIAISTAKSIEFITINNIIYLEADGKYTVFHLLNGSTKVVSKNLGNYEDILPHYIFFRIHHKYIVNLKKVLNINRGDGNYCYMVNGKTLSIAKRRQESLRKFLYL
ncbi:MAG: LytR/AlgR family response regulator transcription factor [Polaribacter sp.]